MSLSFVQSTNGHGFAAEDKDVGTGRSNATRPYELFGRTGVKHFDGKSAGTIGKISCRTLYGVPHFTM